MVALMMMWKKTMKKMGMMVVMVMDDERVRRGRRERALVCGGGRREESLLQALECSAGRLAETTPRTHRRTRGKGFGGLGSAGISMQKGGG